MTNQQYLQRLSLLIGAYAVLLFASIRALQGPAEAAPAAVRVIIGLAPMLPAAGVLAVYMARFRALDELQRNIQSEGLSFAVGATAIITFSYGFLQSATGAPDLSWFWIWPILAATWGLGSALAWRRYR